MNKFRNETYKVQESLSGYDIYNHLLLDNYVDEDVISPSESGFMRGYLNA